MFGDVEENESALRGMPGAEEEKSTCAERTVVLSAVLRHDPQAIRSCLPHFGAAVTHILEHQP